MIPKTLGRFEIVRPIGRGAMGQVFLARDPKIERLVANRLDEIPHETANPGRRAAKELSKQLFPATSRMSR